MNLVRLPPTPYLPSRSFSGARKGECLLISNLQKSPFRERHSFSFVELRRRTYSAEALAEAQGDLGVNLLFGVDSFLII